MKQVRFEESEVPYQTLARFGLTQEKIEDLPMWALEDIGQGRRSPLLPIQVNNDEGETLKSRTRFALVRMEDGKVDVVFYPQLEKSPLEAFTQEQQEDLLAGKAILADVKDADGRSSKAFVQIDTETNQVMSVPTPVIGRNLEVLKDELKLSSAELTVMQKGEPLTLADWDGPEGNTAGPNRIVREALQLLAADYPLFAEFGPNFDQPSQIERSRWEYFLFTELPELSACGVDAVLPESMRRIEKPEIVLTAAASGNARMQKRLATQGMLNAAALADFRWEIAVGDERMTLAELRARINQEGELLSSGSALFHLTKEDLDRLVAEWAEAQKKELSNWETSSKWTKN